MKTPMTIALFLAFLSAPLLAEETAELKGTWMWTWKDSEMKMHKHVLDIDEAGGKLTARERFDGEDSVPVDDLMRKGDEVSFVVTRGERRAEYKGKVIDGKSINGTVIVTIKAQPNSYQWTAERVIDPKK